MSKKRYFLTLNSFLIGILSFALSYYFSSEFLTSLFATTLVLVFYLIFSKSLTDELFTIEENLQNKMQKTMHELNTPVSTIQINSQMLKARLKDEKNLARLKRIEKASDELLELYEQMEYFIKTNIDKVDIKEFELKEAIQTSVKKFEEIKNSVMIEQNISAIMIKTDKTGFIKVLDNLIQNAIKHNQNLGKIEIFTKDSTLYIKDDGDGIDSEDICNIFNKYFQDHKAKGFGLGLAIVKEFCDKYSIDIKIDTSKNGTTFKLNLSKVIS